VVRNANLLSAANSRSAHLHGNIHVRRICLCHLGDGLAGGGVDGRELQAGGAAGGGMDTPGRTRTSDAPAHPSCRPPTVFPLWAATQWPSMNSWVYLISMGGILDIVLVSSAAARFLRVGHARAPPASAEGGAVRRRWVAERGTRSEPEGRIDWWRWHRLGDAHCQYAVALLRRTPCARCRDANLGHLATQPVLWT
jgi:hypothetical protein